MSKQVVVLGGPTGSGESTITKAILERFSNTIRLVTATTRPPRDNEQNGVDYYFFSKEEFARLREAGTIPEAGYVPNRDTYYGTYLPDLQKKLAAGYTILANLQIVGTKFYKENYNATTIFLEPESVDVLVERIRTRSPGLSEEEIALRRADAEREMREEGPFYDYHVKNLDGKLEDAIQEIVGILKKEGYNLG